jgi:putative addiction module component (TIGR02574 family)
MSSADMLAAILRLPAEERARLALELIRSLDTEAEADAADAWDAEIARRGAEVDAGICGDDDGRRISIARATA